MTVFYFSKKFDCMGKNCHENFSDKVKSLVPSFEDGVNGHITIEHGDPHKVWFTCYDSGKHENWTLHGIKKTKFNKNQKKFNAKLPTLKQLENMF